MLTKIHNEPRDYTWGSTTLLAELEGREPTGAPEAEVWFGDHPGSPARLPDGRSLPDAQAEAGLAPLPYLLKLLAAASPLSIQVHPSKQQAVAGWAREAGLAADDPTRNYRDDNHKPELVVALSERFEALCGLRDVAGTRRYLAAFAGVPHAAPLLERLGAAGGDDVVLRDVIGWLLSGDAADVVAAVVDALPTAQAPGFETELAAARRIALQYPGDPGVIVAMLMNVVVLARGEAVFLRAGLLHAYLDGLGVEIMAASDNVLRGGLTPKRVDVDELLTLVETTPAPVDVLAPVPLAGARDVQTYGPGIADFSLAVAHPVDGRPAAMPVDGPTIVLATDGDVVVSHGGESVSLRPGEAAILLDAVGAVTLGGTGEAFVAAPGA